MRSLIQLLGYHGLGYSSLYFYGLTSLESRTSRTGKLNGRFRVVRWYSYRGSPRNGSLCWSRLLRLQTNHAHRIFPIMDHDHSRVIADHNLWSKRIIRSANKP